MYSVIVCSGLVHLKSCRHKSLGDNSLVFWATMGNIEQICVFGLCTTQIASMIITMLQIQYCMTGQIYTNVMVTTALESQLRLAA